MNDALRIIISLIVFPGVLFALLAAMILGWLRGTTRAAIQGWPGLAPSLSVRALSRRMRQSSTLPEGTHALVIQALPVIALICPLLVLVFLPLPANPGTGNPNYTLDIAALGALLLGMPLTRILIGWTIPSPYTRLAAIRSARLLMGYVAPLVLAIAAAVTLANFVDIAGYPTQALQPHLSPFWSRATLTIAGITFLLTLPVLARLTPLHAGQGTFELVGSEYTELSGRELLLMRIAEALQLVAMLGYGIVVFLLPFFKTDTARASAAIIAAIVIAAGLGIWEGIVPRFRTRNEIAPPLLIWFGTPTFLGIVAVLGLVLAQRFA